MRLRSANQVSVQVTQLKSYFVFLYASVHSQCQSMRVSTPRHAPKAAQRDSPAQYGIIKSHTRLRNADSTLPQKGLLLPTCLLTSAMVLCHLLRMRTRGSDTGWTWTWVWTCGVLPQAYEAACLMLRSSGAALTRRDSPCSLTRPRLWHALPNGLRNRSGDSDAPSPTRPTDWSMHTASLTS